MLILVLCFLTAFALSYVAIPHIIKVARDRNLCEEPGERSSHTISTPALGGIGIFCGTVFAVVMWTPFQFFSNLQYILCALIIVFLVGLKDDLMPLQPVNKILGQVMAAAIIVFPGGISLQSFYGIFGLAEALPVPVFAGISLFVILVFINAFNLIDGINGLAGSTGGLVAGVLGCWFLWAGRVELAVLSFGLVGAVLAFLRYNYTPAKTFMGDSGSMLIGTVCAVLAIEFITVNDSLSASSPYYMHSGPVVAIGVMILPLFDTLRVFLTRLFRRQSPFLPDRRHIHHLMIDLGLSHMQATAALTAVNVLFVTLVIALDAVMELHALLALILGLASALTFWLHRSVVRRRQLRGWAA